MKKSLLLLIVVIALAALIPGLAFATGTEEDSAQPVELRYMMWDANQQPAYRQALDIFEAENPGITVEIEVTPWSQYWTKLKTQAAGEAVPDLFWTYVAPLPEIVDLGIVYDITDLIERDGVDLSIYNPMLVSNLQIDGRQYGIPKDWDAIVIFYNTALLAEAGYDEYPTDLSWDPEDGGSFVEFVQSLTLDDQGLHPNEAGFDPDNIVQYGFSLQGFGADILNAFNEQNGGVFYDESGRVAIDSPESLEAYQFLWDLIFKYHVAPDYSVQQASRDALWYNNEVAVQHNGSWMALPYSQNSSFEFGIAMVPEGPLGTTHTRVNGLSDSIYTGTPNLEETWTAVKFLASTATEDIIGATGTVFPAHPDSMQEYVDYYADEIGVDVSPILDVLDGETVGANPSIIWNQIADLWGRESSLAYSGEKDLESAIRAFVAEANAALGF